MGFLSLLLPILTGSLQGVKDWFSYKKETAKAEQDYKLAVLQAQAEQAKQQAMSDSTDLGNRLGATTQAFKQGSFYPLWGVILFSVCFPKQAEVMWHNFALIPDWFQWLFLSVYSAIWGLPIIKGGYGAITDLLQTRREYKIEKIKAFSEAKFFNSIKQSIFTKGVTQSQVEAFQKAIKEGQEE